MTRISKYAMVALALMLAVPVFAQKENAKDNGQDNRGSAPSGKAGQAQPTPATSDPTYVIGPSDELNISVWNQPQLTRTVPVRPDGMISLPLINDVQAAGKTPAQLRLAITEKLSSFVKDQLEVTVIVTVMNSQRVYVLGQVVRAGAYPMLPGMNVLQAISSAGGLAQFAKETGIMILRTENGQQVRLPFNYKDVINGRRPEQNITLKPGDTIVVP
jgi:polysaccharide export outer membrane protein